MEVLSYRLHSRKNSPFPYDGLPSTSKLPTSSSSNPTSKQSSIPNQSQPSDVISQLQEANNVNGDESSDDELPSLRKLLLPTMSLYGNSPRSHFLKQCVQTARSLATISSDLTSTPRERLFNYPEWSLFQYSRTQVPSPKIQFEANSENSQENPIVVEDDDDDGDLMDRSDHTSHQMTVNDPGMEGENTDGHAGGAAHTGEGVANFDPDDAAMSQGDDRLEMTTPASFSPEIPESDSATTLDEERQPNPSVQGDSIPSPSGRRSRSLSVSVQASGCSSEWVFDVFAEDDGGAEGDGLPPSKRVRFSLPPSEAADSKSSPAAAVAVEGVQVPGSAHGDRPPRDDQEYKVQQIIGESGSEYEVTAVTKIWLPKASVGPKLVRKFRAEQRTATRVQTRRSSRLQNKN